MSAAKPRAAFDEQADEFGAVMAATYAGKLCSLGPTHSVATGQELPGSPLRFVVAVRGDATALFWGLSGLTEPEAFAYPAYGYGVEAKALPAIMKGLREPLDWALLEHSCGKPVVRRMMILERELYPRATDASAVLLADKKRTLLGYFPWQPHDRFAVMGAPAKEAAEIAQAFKQGRATVGSVFGNPIVLMHEGAKPPHKLKATLGQNGVTR